MVEHVPIFYDVLVLDGGGTSERQNVEEVPGPRAIPVEAEPRFAHNLEPGDLNPGGISPTGELAIDPRLRKISPTHPGGGTEA